MRVLKGWGMGFALGKPQESGKKTRLSGRVAVPDLRTRFIPPSLREREYSARCDPWSSRLFCHVARRCPCASRSPGARPRIACLKVSASARGSTPSRMRCDRPWTSDQAAIAAAGIARPAARPSLRRRRGRASGTPRRPQPAAPRHRGAPKAAAKTSAGTCRGWRGRNRHRPRPSPKRLGPRSGGERRAEFAEAVERKRGEQRLLVLEMAVSRGRRDADPPRRFARPHRVGAALVEQSPGGGDQGGAQGAG